MFIWDPKILIKHPNSFIKDSHILIEEPNILIGDPQIFILDPNIVIGSPKQILGSAVEQDLKMFGFLLIVWTVYCIASDPET